MLWLLSLDHCLLVVIFFVVKELILGLYHFVGFLLADPYVGIVIADFVVVREEVTWEKKTGLRLTLHDSNLLLFWLFLLRRPNPCRGLWIFFGDPLLVSRELPKILSLHTYTPLLYS